MYIHDVHQIPACTLYMPVHVHNYAACKRVHIHFYILRPLPLPSSLSPTAMAYAAGTLFVSGGLTAKVYTLPANLSSVVAGTHTLAVGHLNYTNLAIVPTSIRDIAINSSSLQQLPGIVRTWGLCVCSQDLARA